MTTDTDTAAETVVPLLDRSGAEHARTLFEAIVTCVAGIVLTERINLELAVACIVAEGHLLIEDLPGLGKTTLAKSLAHAVGLEFHRVQCTADLLPADITGAMVLDLNSRQPVFRKGPVFTNVLMADELNRASPRTQSALLEAMEEHQVSVDGHSEPLPRPFLVVATQNPHDAAGTSPLPHGQRDRFLLRLSLGYPTRSEEDLLLGSVDPATRAGHLHPAVTSSELRTLLEAAATVHVSPAARAYILDLVEATRTHAAVRVGASPRAARSLMRLAGAMAISHGRHYVTPDDIQPAVGPVLAHRLLLHAGDEATGGEPAAVIEEILGRVRVPAATGQTAGSIR